MYGGSYHRSSSARSGYFNNFISDRSWWLRQSETRMCKLPERQQKGDTFPCYEPCLHAELDMNDQCDDQRPCSRCIARSEECIHVARGPKLVKLRCEGCRADNKRCEDSRPCKFCVEGGKECIAVPRKGRGHGTRVKAVSGLFLQAIVSIGSFCIFFRHV